MPLLRRKHLSPPSLRPDTKNTTNPAMRVAGFARFGGVKKHSQAAVRSPHRQGVSITIDRLDATQRIPAPRTFVTSYQCCDARLGRWKKMLSQHQASTSTFDMCHRSRPEFRSHVSTRGSILRTRTAILFALAITCFSQTDAFAAGRRFRQVTQAEPVGAPSQPAPSAEQPAPVATQPEAQPVVVQPSSSSVPNSILPSVDDITAVPAPGGGRMVRYVLNVHPGARTVRMLLNR